MVTVDTLTDGPSTHTQRYVTDVLLSRVSTVLDKHAHISIDPAKQSRVSTVSDRHAHSIDPNEQYVSILFPTSMLISVAI